MADIDPQTILAESKEYANSLKSELSGALSRLESFAAFPLSWVEFAPSAAFVPEKPARIDAGNLPKLERAVLGAEFSDLAQELTEYKGHVFDAPYLDEMQSVLMGWVESGGVGISDNVQTALWDDMRERDLQTLSDALDLAADTDAKRGFAYPTKRRRTSEIITNYQMTRDNRNREITAKLAELAQQNVQNAIAQNISIEQIHSGFSLGLSGVWNNIKNRIIEKFRVEQEARIAEFNGLLSTIQAGYEVAKVNADIDNRYQDLLAKIYEVEKTISTNRTGALIQQSEHAATLRLQAAGGYVAGLSKQLSSALLQTNGIAVTTSNT